MIASDLQAWLRARGAMLELVFYSQMWVARVEEIGVAGGVQASSDDPGEAIRLALVLFDTRALQL